MHRYIIILIIVASLGSCNKDEFLAEKPDQSLVIPTTLTDLQAILDNDQVNNGTTATRGLTFALGDAGSDDYFLPMDSYNVINDFAKRIYSWQKQTFSGSSEEEISWVKCYKSIFYSNTVLDALAKIPKNPSNEAQHNNVHGSALFMRAFMNWQLVQLFSPAYDSSKNEILLGIPLRLTSDVNEKLVRSSQQEAFNLIISDLTKAVELLPDVPAYVTRPSKVASFSLLAKVSLYMNKFQEAFNFANLALSIRSDLYDYSKITGTSSTAALMPTFASNPEVLFFSTQLSASESEMMSPVYFRVDTILYSLYNASDIRKRVFFRQWNSGGKSYYSFRGSYAASATYNFSGLATDENLLIRAECLARRGELNLALSDLNRLLRNRYIKNSFTDITGLDRDALVIKILEERRKELLLRAVRWSDIKRLNMEGNYKVIPKRIINSQEVVIPPGSGLYTYPLPASVVSFNSSMPLTSRE